MTEVLKRAGAILGAIVILLVLLAPQLVGVIYIAGGVIGGGVGVAIRVAVSSDREGPLPYLTAAVGAVLAGIGAAITGDVSNGWVWAAATAVGAILVPLLAALVKYGVTGTPPGILDLVTE